MKKNFKRHPKKLAVIKIKIKNKVISVNWKVFYKKYNIAGIIQILATDFELINKKIKKFTHFNIQNTVHRAGKKYLICKIYKRGSYDGKIYKKNILDGSGFILAKCTYAKNHISYSKFNKKYFKYSLSNIKNIPSLKESIKRRYKKTLSHLSYKEKLSLGVAVTKLKIIKWI